MGVQRQCICGISGCGMAGVWVWKGVGEWLHAQDYVRRAGSSCMSSSERVASAVGTPIYHNFSELQSW